MSCLLLTSDTTPRISWTHVDNESDAQVGYQVQIDRGNLFNSNNGAPDYDSGDVTSANEYHDVSPALSVTGKLYVRVRTRDATHSIAESGWSAENYIILDPVIDDANDLPRITFTIPSDPENDNLHFRTQICTSGEFSSPVVNRYSGDSQTGWEYHNGVDWVAFPSGGVPSTYYGNQCRYTVQPADALTLQQVHALRVQAEEVASEVSAWGYALMSVLINQPPNAPTNLTITSTT